MFSTPLLCGKIDDDYRLLLTRNFDFFMLRACNEKSIWLHEFNCLILHLIFTPLGKCHNYLTYLGELGC